MDATQTVTAVTGVTSSVAPVLFTFAGLAVLFRLVGFVVGFFRGDGRG